MKNILQATVCAAVAHRIFSGLNECADYFYCIGKNTVDC